jgi:hypothetical protein
MLPAGKALRLDRPPEGVCGYADGAPTTRIAIAAAGNHRAINPPYHPLTNAGSRTTRPGCTNKTLSRNGKRNVSSNSLAVGLVSYFDL